MLVSGPLGNRNGLSLGLTENMPQSCIDKMRMDIVITSEKRLRAMTDGGNCDEGIPGYRDQH